MTLLAPCHATAETQAATRELARSRSADLLGTGSNRRLSIMEPNFNKPGTSDNVTGKKKVTKYCSVPQCNNYYRIGLRFHHFPQDKDARSRWEGALKMGKSASSTMLVCGEHFVPSDYFPSANNRQYRLYPHSVPSRNLPVRPLDKIRDTSPRKRARQARSSRAEGRRVKQRFLEEDESSDFSDTEPPAPPSPAPKEYYNKSTQANLFDERTDHKTHEEGFSLADMISENTNDKATQAHLNQPDKQPSTSEKPSKPVNLTEVLSSDSKLFTFTGIHSLDMLNALVKCVSDIDTDYATSRKVLSLRDRIILTMIKIKMNLSFTAIAILFGIGRKSCAKYFRAVCPLLSKVLEGMIPWPDQEDIRCNLPLSFENYKKTRIVLDCAETPVEVCACLKCRVLTYSQYKKRHTLKWCVGIAPSGLITFMSRSYGGRASDKLIVNKSGILDKLEVNDIVMVDKGFSIENECLERHVKLVRPPFLRQKKQLSREDALLTADIARARVHVERAIQRLRQYELIQGTIPWHLASCFDDCLIIVAGLTNLGPPITNIDKFM